jgi:protoporphyrinogen oxidase
METVILGSGIAGLGASHAANLKGRPSEIFESRAVAGGLLDNIVIDGFYFDTAVHLSFASEPEVREIFDRAEFITHTPLSLNWDNGNWLKHPAQTNMFPLAVSEKVELIAGLAESKSDEVNNYRDWLVQQYGTPIAERWPLIYTEKYWTVPAEALGTKWVGQRMRKADLREVLQGAFNAETPNQYYVKEMRYPQKGGYKSFIAPLIADATINYDHKVVQIDQISKQVEFENGNVVQYEKLISTIPLPAMVSMMRDVPIEVKEASKSLFATEIDLISVAFNKEKVSPALWFYIYDTDILASRAYSPDWKSPDNVPSGCSALQFEIYWSREKPRNVTVEELKANVLQSIVKMGLATEADILFMHHTYVPYANVVFDLGMEERRDLVKNWVSSQGINVAGRFGEWEYLWSNQAMSSGMKAYNEAWHQT